MATDNNRTKTPNDAVKITELPEGSQLLLVDSSGVVLERMEAERFMELVRASVQVGGRNLIPDSEHISIASSTGAYHYLIAKTGLSVKAGESFVASYGTLAMTGPQPVRFQITIFSRTLEKTIASLVLTDSERTVMAKVSADDPNAAIYIYAGLPGATANMSLDVTQLKLERGNVVSDWTPAPEDLGFGGG